MNLARVALHDGHRARDKTTKLILIIAVVLYVVCLKEWLKHT